MVALRQVVSVVCAIVLMAMVIGCGGQDRTKRALSEKDERIKSLEDNNAGLTAEKRQLQTHCDSLADQNQKLAGQNKEMAERNAKILMGTDSKIDALNKQIADLEKSLGANKKEGDIVVVPYDKNGAITIRVANTVLFDTGKAELKSSAHTTLNKVAQTLKGQFSANFVRVEGHTDSTPVIQNKKYFKDNMELSQARSKAVFDYLVNQAHMPANKMYTAGYSYFQPVVWPEKSAADRAKNRRVDIVILPNVKVAKENLAQR